MMASPLNGHINRSHSSEEVQAGLEGGHIESQPAVVVDVENQNGADRSQSGTSGAQLQQAESMPLQEQGARERLWIMNDAHELLREAYNMWTEKDNLFVIRAEKKKKQTSSLYNEIYQLVGFFSVFQGVLLTAVAQSNLLTCHNWWTAFFLSLLASLVTICGVIQKFKFIIELDNNMNSEDLSRKDCIRLRNLLVRNREQFSFREHAKDLAVGAEKSNLRWSAVGVVVLLALFSSLFLASIYRILCDSGDPVKNS